MSGLREKTVSDLYQIMEKRFSVEDEPKEAFAKMLFLTVCRNGVMLNKLISSFLNKGISQKYALARTILQTGAAELLFMESPAYAVINEYVEITKKHCRPLSGLVNAVLRGILRNKAQILSDRQIAFFPESFKNILQADYSDEDICKIEQAAVQEPPLNITVKHSAEMWAEKLGAQVVSEDGLVLFSAGKITDLPGYDDGQWWVQDTAAALAVRQFSNLKGKRVLDLCAAPGGKTAQLINAGARVTSLDCSEERLTVLRQNMKRLRLEPEQIVCADAADYLKNFSGEVFDAVLLDAPCSASGIFRRHPQVVYLKEKSDIAKQAALQKKILASVSPVLKNGGELVYCTCSIAKAEGETQILDFVRTCPDFKIARLTNPLEPQSITTDGFIRTLPFHYAAKGGCDAFFVAKLIKDCSDDK